MRSRPTLTTPQRHEIERCQASVIHFVQHHVQIYNATERAWIPFLLWPTQCQVIRTLRTERLTLILKARQLGLSWLALAYALWLMRFHPAVSVLIFNRRDEEAAELLSRIKGIDARLPGWMRQAHLISDNGHTYGLSNGSVARAFPTTGGRGHTGSLVILDEADFMPDLDGLLNAVKPTIDAGGQMVVISTADKSQPESTFKRMYRAAREGVTAWAPIFLPWHARPDRDDAWYAEQKADILARTGSEDDLHQEYAATDTEALSPRTLDKRIPAPWIEACYAPMTALAHPGPSPSAVPAPAIEPLQIYRTPTPDARYVMGLDPAEGNPTSDDSAFTVLNVMTGEECAVLSGKFEPDIIAAHADTVGRYYNNAGLMPERNNHGHAVISWLKQNSRLRLLHGHDDKEGWLSSSLGKALLYNEMANAFRNQETILHSFATYTQLASIEGKSLRAPEGQHDDRADSYALAQVGRAAMMRETTAMKQARIPGRGGDTNVRRAVRRIA